jgi:CRP/FNR family transcriptional regulator, cyclic AMP receptor protein
MSVGDLNISQMDSPAMESHEYFAILGSELTDKILKNKMLRNYKKGDVLLKCDEPSKNFIYIYDGVTKILTYLPDGREFVVDTPKQGSVLGEIDILHRTKSTFEVRALSFCTVCILDGKIVRDALATDPDLSSRLLPYVARRVTELERRLLCLAQMSISSRLASTLLRLSSTSQSDKEYLAAVNISQHELASMLPASREKVNKCLREWKRSRIVDLEPGIITITNPQALHAYAIC